MIEPLDSRIPHALRDPRAYPADPSAAGGVEEIQTHLSFVFRTPARVYKLRKAVRLEFADFGSRAARNADCLREVSLNRRLAPDVYLGVAPVALEGGAIRVGTPAERLAGAAGAMDEHCVVMRRLPEGRDALSLLQARRLRPAQLDRVAARIARFHGEVRLGTPAPFSREDWRRRIAVPVEDNFRALERTAGSLVPRAWLVRGRELARELGESAATAFEERRQQGRAVDGHGDLHLQHVWLETDDSEPLLIDCLEFNEKLRRIDAAADIAFLAMDLAYRGRPLLAQRFLQSYARESDDWGLYRVVDYYVSYRAAVRAKVAALAAADPAIPAPQRVAAAASARRHLRLVVRALQPRGGGALVLACGIVGTGKSSAAAILADALGGALLASDRLRKRLAGLGVTQRAASSFGTGLYTKQRTQAVYRGLLERARPVVESGRPAVLDATFARRALRAPALRLARALGVPAFLVETRCSRREALARLERRERAGRDASDAGPAHYPSSARGFQRPVEWPRGARFVLHTDRPDWRARARALARRIRGRTDRS